MGHLLVSAGLGVLLCAGAVGQHIDPPAGSSRVPTCDTVYVGPPGGSLYNPLNWTHGLPRPGDVACFPDDQRRVDSVNPPKQRGVGSLNPPDRGRLVSAGIEVRMIPSTREQTGGSDDPLYGAPPYIREYSCLRPRIHAQAVNRLIVERCAGSPVHTSSEVLDAYEDFDVDCIGTVGFPTRRVCDRRGCRGATNARAVH